MGSNNKSSELLQTAIMGTIRMLSICNNYSPNELFYICSIFGNCIRCDHGSVEKHEARDITFGIVPSTSAQDQRMTRSMKNHVQNSVITPSQPKCAGRTEKFKTPRTRSRKLKLDNLPVDCLLHVFERLDIRTLCAIAGTSKKFQSIARKLFELKKITVGIFACQGNCLNTFNWKNPIYISGLSLCEDTLRHFGEFFHIIDVRVSNDDQSLFEYIVKYCSGTLETLVVQSHPNIQQVNHLDMKPLFKHLRDLRIYSANFDLLKFPFDICEQLSSLHIRDCDEKLVVNLLKHEFPSLKVLKICQNNIPEGIVDQFLLKHQKLIVFMITQRNQQYHSFATLANLERLFVHEADVSMRELIGKMPLKHFGMQRFYGRDQFIEFIESSLVLRDHLEVFSAMFCGLIADNGSLLDLLQFRKLRELRIHGPTSFHAQRIIDVLEQLIHGFEEIEIIELNLLTTGALENIPMERDLIEGRITFSSKRFPTIYLNKAHFVKNGRTNLYASANSYWTHFLNRTHPCEQSTE